LFVSLVGYFHKAFLEEMHTTLRAEQEQLNHSVQERNLSPEEANRMITDFETLTRTTDDLKQKISDTERHVMSMEINCVIRSSSAEEMLDNYNVSLSTLGLLFLPTPHDHIDLIPDLNTASSDPHQLLVGADIRKVIKPTRNEIVESKHLMRAEVET
jgi:kinetochore protein NDC80